MKKYYAIIEIGGYKPEQEVSKEKGELWLFMYKYPPVRVVEVPDPVPNPLDLNKDGRVDSADLVIANKVISAIKVSGKKGKK